MGMMVYILSLLFKRASVFLILRHAHFEESCIFNWAVFQKQTKKHEIQTRRITSLQVAMVVNLS